MTGSAAAMQALVGSEPHLIHYYTFEGETSADRLRDRRGDLDLSEVAMRNGNGGGHLAFTRTGPDPSLNVLVPFRAEQFGATHGCGLQSKAMFQPPVTMTVETMLYLSGRDKDQEGFVAAAVATRCDRDRCGFLLAGLRGGELGCLLDGGAEWLRSGFNLVPGRWYYVASTFRVNGTETEINTYVAELGGKSSGLNCVVRDRVVPGTPAAGRLGIGKGFDGEMASAYPWDGQIGPVAIYDTVLPQQALEEHLAALRPAATGK